MLLIKLIIFSISFLSEETSATAINLERVILMPSFYINQKVNNEIELCEVSGLECKKAVERALLQKRISYFIRWLKPSIFSFSRKKNICIFCVNDNVRDEAETVVRAICDEAGYAVRFIMKKSQVDYL